MLQKLLNEIRQGGPQELKALAARLDTTPQVVEALLEHLQRTGYIRRYTTCENGCQGCSLQAQCQVTDRTGLRLWTLVGRN